MAASVDHATAGVAFLIQRNLPPLHHRRSIRAVSLPPLLEPSSVHVERSTPRRVVSCPAIRRGYFGVAITFLIVAFPIRGRTAGAG